MAVAVSREMGLPDFQVEGIELKGLTEVTEMATIKSSTDQVSKMSCES